MLPPNAIRTIQSILIHTCMFNYHNHKIELYLRQPNILRLKRCMETNCIYLMDITSANYFAWLAGSSMDAGPTQPIPAENTRGLRQAAIYVPLELVNNRHQADYIFLMVNKNTTSLVSVKRNQFKITFDSARRKHEKSSRIRRGVKCSSRYILLLLWFTAFWIA